MHRRLLWFTVPSQAFQVLPLFAASHTIELAVRMMAGSAFPGFLMLLAPVIESLLWPIVSVILLSPQRRTPNPDHQPIRGAVFEAEKDIRLIEPPEAVRAGIDRAEPVMNAEIELSLLHLFDGLSVEDACRFECGRCIIGRRSSHGIQKTVDVLSAQGCSAENKQK